MSGLHRGRADFSRKLMVTAQSFRNKRIAFGYDYYLDGLLGASSLDRELHVDPKESPNPCKIPHESDDTIQELNDLGQTVQHRPQ